MTFFDVSTQTSLAPGELETVIDRAGMVRIGGLDRHLDHATAEAALDNPDPAVRALGLDGLRELAADGNPFAIAALKRLLD